MLAAPRPLPWHSLSLNSLSAEVVSTRSPCPPLYSESLFLHSLPMVSEPAPQDVWRAKLLPPGHATVTSQPGSDGMIGSLVVTESTRRSR
jgi:hypothetical protein